MINDKQKGRLSIIMAVAANVALLLFAVMSFQNGLPITVIVDAVIIYVAMLAVGISYFMLMNTAKGLSFFGKKTF